VASWFSADPNRFMLIVVIVMVTLALPS